MIKLFSNASPNGIKIIIMLEELRIPYEHVWIDQYKDQQFFPDFVAINPNSKVPAIIDGERNDLAIFESGAILIYLAEKSGRFLAAEEPARSAAFSWLMLQMSGIGPILGHYNHFASSDYSNQVVPYAIQRFGNEARRLLSVLDGRLARNPWFAGDDYSIADMAIYPWMWLLNFIGLPDAGLLHVRAWRDRMEERPAVARAHNAWEQARVKSRAAKDAATPEQLDRYFGRIARVT